jgi:hypothetical protein
MESSLSIRLTSAADDTTNNTASNVPPAFLPHSRMRENAKSEWLQVHPHRASAFTTLSITFPFVYASPSEGSMNHTVDIRAMNR